MSSRTISSISFQIAVAVMVAIPALQAGAAQNPRYYIQSSPLPTREYVRDLSKRLSTHQFEIFGDQLGSLTDLPKIITPLEDWAKKVPDGVVIIWNPNRIEQQFGFSSLMRTIDSLGKLAVVMVGFHPPSAAIMKVNPVHETYSPNCKLLLNWVNPTRRT